MLDALGFLDCSVVITYPFLLFRTRCLDNHAVGTRSRQQREGEELSVEEIRNGARGRQIVPVPPLLIRPLRNEMVLWGTSPRSHSADEPLETD
jgi:hypothetical protein